MALRFRAKMEERERRHMGIFSGVQGPKPLAFFPPFLMGEMESRLERRPPGEGTPMVQFQFGFAFYAK